MRALALLLVATSLAAQDPVDLAGWINRGVQEFKAARYPEAVAAFERAVAIDPSNVAAQLYLGTAYMQQFIPGAESPENLRIAETAQAHFLRALDLEPSNKVALASMASLALNQKKWDDAQQWYEKITASDPNNAEAWYSMGFLAWSKWYPAYAKARASLGMRPEEPGPIKDGGVRADLTGRYGAVLESGLRALEKALEIDPQYDDAMAYMNLLIRERADLRDTAEEYKRDIADCRRLGDEGAGDQEGEGRAAECERAWSLRPRLRRLRRASGSQATWSKGNAGAMWRLSTRIWRGRRASRERCGSIL